MDKRKIIAIKINSSVSYLRGKCVQRTLTPNFIHDPVKNKKKKQTKSPQQLNVSSANSWENTKWRVRSCGYTDLSLFFLSLSFSLRVHQVHYINILYYRIPTVKFDALLCNILLCNKQVYYEKYKSKRKEHFGLFIRIRVGMPVAQKKELLYITYFMRIRVHRKLYHHI